jgi:hypothetical protein
MNYAVEKLLMKQADKTLLPLGMEMDRVRDRIFALALGGHRP